MYKVVTKEDTIRIPAEYIRKDKYLNEHIDRLAASAFEGRFDDNNRFVLVTSNHEPIDRGRIIHGDGAKFTDSATTGTTHTITPTGTFHTQDHGGIAPAMTWPAHAIDC